MEARRNFGGDCYRMFFYQGLDLIPICWDMPAGRREPNEKWSSTRRACSEKGQRGRYRHWVVRKHSANRARRRKGSTTRGLVDWEGDSRLDRRLTWIPTTYGRYTRQKSQPPLPLRFFVLYGSKSKAPTTGQRCQRRRRHRR
nr:hypothetical protein CFP56_21105 [Quercus suber]